MVIFPDGFFHIHVKWVSCHHGMEHPHAADREDGLQTWRVAVNILNKQSQTASRGWVWREANNSPTIKPSICYEML
jgi:hypothetical protein